MQPLSKLPRKKTENLKEMDEILAPGEPGRPKPTVHRYILFLQNCSALWNFSLPVIFIPS